MINTRLQVSGDQHVAVSLADLLLVGGLQFRASAYSDLAGFGEYHSTVLIWLQSRFAFALQSVSACGAELRSSHSTAAEVLRTCTIRYNQFQIARVHT